MKKIVINRIVAAFLLLVISFSVCVPASASGLADSDSVAQWDSRFDTAVSRATTLILTPCCISLGIPISTAPKTVMWRLFDRAVDNTGTGEVSLDRLNDICAVYNGYFNRPVRQSLFGLKDVADNIATTAFCICMGFYGSFNFVVEAHPSSGFYRIKETTTGLWVVDSNGLYPFCWGASEAPTSGGNQWVGERSCSTAKVNMKNLDTLNLLCNKIKESGTACQIRALGTNYKAIWYNYQYYCDPEGRPFVCYANESQAAVNQDRPDTSVTDEKGEPAKDETGTVINNPDNSTNIDLSGMTITLPDGTVQVADAVIYDESTKTYYIDSHDTTNNYVTYNYSWTYNINYTSITYIGTTAEYDKYYNVYYELPDGRDSADLTAEELEQLDFGIDVVGYGRSADDTSLRSLYHFDGDTRDSSYWNYCTNFQWISGASLTYMDASAFNGALYLDENLHEFSFLLPSNIGNGDFTMQFRYYQSATAAPQTDSFIAFYSKADCSAWSQPLLFDGQSLKTTTATLAKIPTGQWNEICLERSGGVIYYMLNGVLIGSVPDSKFYYNRIYFGFGSAQQTYKYFDEFRFTNKALYVAPYTCSSVPFDTNLSLVLPDSAKPVADEYWSFDKTITPVWSYDFTNSTYPAFQGYTGTRYCYVDGPIQQNEGYLTLFPQGTAISPAALHLVSKDADDSWSSSYSNTITDTWSIVDSSGNIYSVTHPAGAGLVTQETSWGSIKSNGQELYVYPNTGQSVGVVYAECVEGGTPNTGHKFVTSITPVTSFTKPTLAVRTDIPITSKQIGGARPSLPATGMVWALVEDGVIQSIQIYNGSAWEQCDGRIFTGTRWIPYSAYNIITMKDFYDVADASGDSYEYIYTEAGFWSWWQKSWNAFTTKLFSALSSAGMDVSGTNADGTSTSLWQRIKDAFNDTLGALIESLFDLIKEVLKTLISSASDMLQFFFSFLTDSVLNAVKSFFSAFSDNSLFDFFKQPPVIGPDGTQSDGGYGLPNEVGTGFNFISGVIMILPPDIRSILFFGIGIMVLMGVFKLVKA